MNRSIAGRKQILVSTLTALLALGLPSCNGAGAHLGANGPIPQTRLIAPLSGTASPTPIPFDFQTVDDPNSHVNRVMGLNQRAKIVGTYGVGSASTIPASYSASPPYDKFRPQNYPGAQGTVATSVSSTHTIGGYVLDPNGQGGIWGLLDINGLATLIDDPSEASGSDAVTEILGVSDAGEAVGFYVNSSGAQVPFELNIAQGYFTDLTPPGAADAEATGVSSKGNITGTETLASGAVVGFYIHAGTYFQIIHPKAKVTEALALNRQDQVAGEFKSKNKIHGFILTYPTNGGDKQVWQTVDEPNARGTTVVTGINDHDTICGWFQDASGIIHGFVATPKKKR